MKAFTDIEQSKKLAEILHLESADMHYSKHSVEDYYSPVPLIGKYSEIQDEIPCWSLAALLNAFPDDYNILFAKSSDKNTESARWLCEASDGISVTFKFSWYDDNPFDVSHDSPIDACVSMIIGLHDAKKL